MFSQNRAVTQLSAEAEWGRERNPPPRRREPQRSSRPPSQPHQPGRRRGEWPAPISGSLLISFVSLPPQRPHAPVHHEGPQASIFLLRDLSPQEEARCEVRLRGCVGWRQRKSFYQGSRCPGKLQALHVCVCVCVRVCVCVYPLEPVVWGSCEQGQRLMV